MNIMDIYRNNIKVITSLEVSYGQLINTIKPHERPQIRHIS